MKSQYTKYLLLIMIFMIQPATTLLAQTTLKLEVEAFQYLGDWTNGGPYKDASGSGHLASVKGALHPAVTAIQVPEKGTYTLWVRTVDFPGNRPGQRYCNVSVGGKQNGRPFGQSGKAGWQWERGDQFDLPQGKTLLSIYDNSGMHWSRVDALILTSEKTFIPNGNLERMGGGNAKVVEIEATSNDAVQISSLVKLGKGKPLAQLKNEYLDITFVSVKRGEKQSVSPAIKIKRDTGWVNAPLDASAESYQVVYAAGAPDMQINGFHPKWKISDNNSNTIIVNAGGAKCKTTKARGDNLIWYAGQGYEGIVKSVVQLDARRILLDFYPTDVGTLQAIWELIPEDKTVRVEMALTPNKDGQFSLGYFLFNSKPIGEVDELLLPMLVQRKRFPAQCATLLHTASPTPVSLFQTDFSGAPLTWGLSGDPEMVPFEFPVPIKSRYGLHIRDPRGEVHPSIYGPLIGTPQAKATAGQPIKFAFHLFVKPGDWYSAYRMVADDVFEWRDYRKNGDVSLTKAALNMIDLYTDDQNGGWWPRAKAPYQVESKNGSTQSTPLTALSLYYLTGDDDLYQRRTLPTLEFMLSRDGPHFSPIPSDTGGYPRGSMQGPVDIFGTTVYGGLWQMSNQRTAAFGDIAFPNGGICESGMQQSFLTHNQSFDEWLGRYLYTGDQAALKKTIELADAYLASCEATTPSIEFSLREFFLMAYTPTWEGLLRLYEVTGKKKYLDASAAGARLLLTGMWTQPMPKDEMITIHHNNDIHGDKMDRRLHKGEEEYRLGWPRDKGDVQEKQVPAWLVSHTGLGFEQPSTYTYKDNGGRLILQSPWATQFLRLALYTGDKQFETYARNAVVGRSGNYAGYYYTTFTDVMQAAEYPYTGPDVGFIYFHHLPVHLSWTIDYLVSEAKLASGGAISFPGVRQYGYAYFDNLVYGHQPGVVMGNKGAWLWFDKNLVELDNPQINYLTAHTDDTFYLIMMNESSGAEQVAITFDPAAISRDHKPFISADILTGPKGNIAITNNKGAIMMPPRGMVVLAIGNLDIDVAAHKTHAPPTKHDNPTTIKTKIDSEMALQAASIQMKPGKWQAYVWATADEFALKEINLTYTIGNKTKLISDIDYPYEFSVPVPAGQTSIRFHASGTKADGTPFKTKENMIGVAND